MWPQQRLGKIRQPSRKQPLKRPQKNSQRSQGSETPKPAQTAQTPSCGQEAITAKMRFSIPSETVTAIKKRTTPALSCSHQQQPQFTSLDHSTENTLSTVPRVQRVLEEKLGMRSLFATCSTCCTRKPSWNLEHFKLTTMLGNAAPRLFLQAQHPGLNRKQWQGDLPPSVAGNDLRAARFGQVKLKSPPPPQAETPCWNVWGGPSHSTIAAQ